MRIYGASGDREHFLALGFEPGIIYSTQGTSITIGSFLRTGRRLFVGDYPTLESPYIASFVLEITKLGFVYKDNDWNITTQWQRQFESCGLLGVRAEGPVYALSPCVASKPAQLARPKRIKIFAYVPLLGRPSSFSVRTVCDGIFIQPVSSQPVPNRPLDFALADNMNFAS